MPNNPTEDLPLETQFALTKFTTEVAGLSEEATKQMLVELYKQLLLKEEVYKRFLKESWGIGC